jgi:hypothetical protein
MTRMGRISTDLIRDNPSHPRHPCPILPLYQAKWANALLDSAILVVFSRLVMASPSRR